MKKRALSIVAAAVLLAVAGCSGSGSSSHATAKAPADPAKVSGDITVLTNRTDLVNDGTLKKYAAQFNQIYPNVHVTFQGITDYEGEDEDPDEHVELRRRAAHPERAAEVGVPEVLRPLGTATDLDAKYRFIDNGTRRRPGLRHRAERQRQRLRLQQEGLDGGRHHRMADDSDEFIADLQAIKAKTAATPYYTNYHDGWPMTSWEGAVGSVSLRREGRTTWPPTTAPWASRSGAQHDRLDCCTTSCTTSSPRPIRPRPTGRTPRR